MTKKKDKTGKEIIAVKEPDLPYGTKVADNSIHFFMSFEEQEEDNYRYIASLTPLQHLENATRLIKQIFADELKKNKKATNRIIFD